MREDLNRDLEEEQTIEESILEQREELWIDVEPKII